MAETSWKENFDPEHPRLDNIGRKVYVGNLTKNPPRSQDLEWEFAWFGKITNCWLARSPPGFGYIEFKDSQDAIDAAKEMNGAFVCGRTIKCEMANDVEERKHRQKMGAKERGRDRTRSRSSRRSRSRSSSRSRSCSGWSRSRTRSRSGSRSERSKRSRSNGSSRSGSIS